jgi:hypothetical protein
VLQTYFYLKAQSYPAGSFAVVTRGQAENDADAAALAEKDEIVCRVVEGTKAFREDQDRIDTMRAHKARQQAKADAEGITLEALEARELEEFRRNYMKDSPSQAPVAPAIAEAPAPAGDVIDAETPGDEPL